MKTSFQNLSYLEKALNNLNISYLKKTSSTIQENFENETNNNLIIPQSNEHDIIFSWNGQEYELVSDLSFWNQPYPVETFLNKVAHQYAGNVIINKSQEIGFQPTHCKQNLDGSTLLILERWKG